MRVALLLGLWLVSSAASADSSRFLGRENPLASLIPTAATRLAAERERLERELERALSMLAGVQSAQVVLSLPAPDGPLDGPAGEARASVLLRVHGESSLARGTARSDAPGPADVVRLVVGAVPGMLAEQVSVTRSPASAGSSGGGARAAQTPFRTTRVGPFLVATKSAALLRGTLAVCLLSNALLAATLLLRRRAR